MLNNPLVSIIIPAFKSKYLKESLASALSQTYKNIEIIIVNDASPEDLKSIINLFPDKRIKYYENAQNIGGTDLVKNWNRCLQLCKGEFFILFSDDDILDSECVLEMLKLVEKYPEYNVYKCRTKIINDQGNLMTLSPTGPTKEFYLDFIWHQIMSYRSHSASEFLYRTQFIKNMNGFVSFPIAYYSDYASICKFIKNSYLISTTQALVSFRMSGDNLSSAHNKNLEKSKALFKYISWMQSYIKSDTSKDIELKKLIIKALDSRKNRDLKNYIFNANFCDILRIYKQTPKDMKSLKLLFTAILSRVRRFIYKNLHI